VKAAILGCVVAGLLAVATAAASWPGSPLRAGAPERSDVPSVVFLAAAACAFAAYLAGLLLLRRSGAALAAACALAVAIQLVPLAGPLLLSKDAYAYWDYGRLETRHDANPYAVAPSRFPADPAAQAMAPAWRTTKSVYGPVFTGASAGLAQASGRSGETAAFAYRLAAAAGMLVLVAVAALVAPLPAFGVAFVGWNPLLAIDFAGGGHNDVWMMVFVLGALGLAARHPHLSGTGWALAAGVKWVAIALLPLGLLREPRGRDATLGFLAAAGAIATAAFLAFGTAWLTAVVPVAQRHAAWAIPSRLGAVGLPGWLALAPLAIAVPWLVRSARDGRGRLGLTSGLLLVGTPWLLPWYAVWAVALAAIEEDAAAWVLTLALCAYLLPDRVPI
jgi:alpha-1,6-mannosyltransferase